MKALPRLLFVTTTDRIQWSRWNTTVVSLDVEFLEFVRRHVPEWECPALPTAIAFVHDFLMRDRVTRGRWYRFVWERLGGVCKRASTPGVVVVGYEATGALVRFVEKTAHAMASYAADPDFRYRGWWVEYAEGRFCSDDFVFAVKEVRAWVENSTTRSDGKMRRTNGARASSRGAKKSSGSTRKRTR